MNLPDNRDYEWLETGAEMLRRMLTEIEAAKKNIRLEMFIVHAGETAARVRDALAAACHRGVKVQVLVDAFGSVGLADTFWNPLRTCGGEFRWFNPLTLTLSIASIRDHRKLLVCDDRLAFIGGVNIATEYDGDGVNSGWCDLGMLVRGPLIPEMAAAFDQMFANADFSFQPFVRLRKKAQPKVVAAPAAQLLLGGPAATKPVKLAMRRDLAQARSVRIVCAYFLPPWRLRHELGRAARRGARVQLILPGKSDVPLSRLAGHSFYRRLLQAGVEIYEYQPQILHAKLYVIDNVVYAGSNNLDPRALDINYELMLRLSDPRLAQEGAEIFERILVHSKRIDLEEWRTKRTLWARFKSRIAYLVVARLDPMLAAWQWRGWMRKVKKT